MPNYMLDTSIVIYVIKSRPSFLRPLYNRRFGQMCISTITIAEYRAT